MPIYEYRCDQCDVEFEALLLRNSPPAICPSCGGDRLTRRLSLTMANSRGRQARNRREEERRKDRVTKEKAYSYRHPDHDH